MSANKLKQCILSNPLKPFTGGFRSFTKEEVKEFKAWLKENNIAFEHRVKTKDHKPLPFNGVIAINPTKNWKKWQLSTK